MVSSAPPPLFNPLLFVCDCPSSGKAVMVIMLIAST